MTSSSDIKKWLIKLSQKKEVKLSDIDTFANLFFSSIEKSWKLHRASEKVEDLNIKTNLNILAIEEIAKPIILSEIIPVPGKKWSINKDLLISRANETRDHSIKQITTSNYGKTTGILGYKIWLNEKELEILDQVKQAGFYVSVDPDTEKINDGSSSVNKDLSDKLYFLVKERLNSLSMYKSIDDAKAFIREMVLVKVFDMTKYYIEFIENTNFKEMKNFEEVLFAANTFEPNKNNPDLIIIDASLGNVENQIINSISKTILNDKKLLIGGMTPKFVENRKNLFSIIL